MERTTMGTTMGTTMVNNSDIVTEYNAKTGAVVLSLVGAIDSSDRKLTIVNPEDSGSRYGYRDCQLFVIQLGFMFPDSFGVWATCLQDALDSAVDYCDDILDGRHIEDELYQEAHEDARAELLDCSEHADSDEEELQYAVWDKVYESGEFTLAGNRSAPIDSGWRYVEIADRAELFDYVRAIGSR